MTRRIVCGPDQGRRRWSRRIRQTPKVGQNRSNCGIQPPDIGLFLSPGRHSSSCALYCCHSFVVPPKEQPIETRMFSMAGGLCPRTLRAACLVLVCALALVPRPASAQSEGAAVRPRANATTKPFTFSTGADSLGYPSDSEPHENNGRLNVGPSDGLVPTGRGGFRTVYGAIVALVDDPEAGKPDRTIESSTKAIVDSILKRNVHQSISVPVKADRPFAGAPAASAVLIGTSPVTDHGERAEIVCRTYGTAQVLYVILVSPVDAHATLERPL